VLVIVFSAGILAGTLPFGKTGPFHIGAAPSFRIASSPVLFSVTVSPSADTLSTGGRAAFTAIPTCYGGPCPAGVFYNWSLTNSDGTLNYTFPNTVITSQKTGGEVPVGIAYDSANGNIYVTNDNSYDEHSDSNVSVISGMTNTVIDKVTVGDGPTGIAYDSDNGYLYVANCGSGNMSVINGGNNSVVATIPVTLTGCTIGSKYYMNFAGVAFDPANHYIYVSNYGNSTVSVVNTFTNRVVKAIAVTGDPWGIAYDSSNREVYVTDGNEQEVNVINGTTNKVVTNVTVGINPAGIDYDSDNGDIYVADAGNYVHNPAGDGNVTVINGSTNTVLTSISVRGYPWSVAYDSGNGCIYETDSNITVMKVISGTSNTVVATVPIGPIEHGYSTDFASVYDSANGNVYVTGFCGRCNGVDTNNSVSVIGGASNTNSFLAGMTPGEVNLFVNATLNGVTMQSAPVPINITLAKTYESEFNESGLPWGALWYLNVTGQSSVPTTSVTAGISLPNGTYSYTIAVCDKAYRPSLASSSFTVSGSAVFRSVTFTLLTYQVTFNETGLPVGTEWYLNVTGQPSLASGSITARTDLPNGTYSYAIATNDKRYAPSLASSDFVLSGSSLVEVVKFLAVTFAITFTEGGLAAGTNWSVAMNGAWSSSTNTTISVSEVNGTYSFNVGAVDGYTANQSSGTLAVSGTPASRMINFAKIPPGQYVVEFSESGLLAGTNWSVTLDMVQHFSTGSTITFTEPNDTYSYTVNHVVGYTATPPSGRLVVSGKAVYVSIVFTANLQGEYTVAFTESGLPSGELWSVALAGNKITSTTSTIAFTEPNQTYSFSVGTVAGYIAAPGSGTVVVSGSSVLISIAYSPVPIGQYVVEFDETGLPIGENWSVTLDGVLHYSTGTTIMFTENNGTFSFVVANLTGRTASPSHGSITIAGANVTRVIAFSASSGGGTSLPLSITLIAIIAGAVVAALVVSVVLGRMSREGGAKPVPPSGKKGYTKDAEEASGASASPAEGGEPRK
jgi:YVTN family beta-propeller protein